MPEQWQGEIWYGHLKIDNAATAWLVYQGDGKWNGVVRASRRLPEHVDAFCFHSRDGRGVSLDVKERTKDGGRSVLEVCAIAM